MPGHHHTLFTTVRNEGTLLPSDFLQRVATYDSHLSGLTPSAYHHHDMQLNEAITDSWNRLLRTWTNFKSALGSAVTDDKIATTLTQERWLQQIFVELYYGHLPHAQPLEVDGKRYTISHHWNHTPIHLVSFKEKLDEKRTQGKGLHYSPHSLVQQYINHTSRQPWGIVSNGLRLRLLRKNMHMIRQSYLEFDLEAMMQGEVYADFILFWLLCHKSRLEIERPEGCWLEQWSHSAQDEGIRALNRHSTNVEKAIVALGKGFLACGTNQPLHEKLRSGALSDLDYYRQLLRLVYRLIVLFVAEDREVLFHPASHEQARQRYNDYYSTTRLRRLADLNPGTPHVDLFRGLRLIMEQLGQPGGYPELGLSPLNGFLFSKKAIPDLETCDIANSDLLDAIRALLFTFDGKTRQRVNYKHIGSEELGNVYEGLLELHPILNIEAKTFELERVKGNERKTTGSYYTPSDLVNCLLDSALEPIIREALAKPDAAQALLDLKICDPACGSGHFLVAAAHRIATRLAVIRAKDEEPTPEKQRTALRDVVSCCIYGVDINPMAVELCKVSLWMESIEPGKPLSFLDHHIRCGNSLIGATPMLLRGGIPDRAFEPIEGDDKKLCSEYRKLNKKLREGNRTLFDPEGQPWESLSNLTNTMMTLEDMSDDTVEDYYSKEERFLQTRTSADYLSNRLLADAWCAAFVWKKTKEFSYPITDEVLWKIEHNPDDIKLWMKEEIGHLQEQYQFFHWYLEFRSVFREPANGEKLENEQTGWWGGFDVVLGNPPWERIKLQEKEWFATKVPDIANAANASERQHLISGLANQDAITHAAFIEDQRQAEGEGKFVRESGRYRLCGRGDVNTYAIFAENMRSIVGVTGRVGCIIPSGIATDDTTKYFFQNLMESHSLASLYDFENKDGLFSSVHRSYKFCLLTLMGSTSAQPLTRRTEFVFFAHQVQDLQDYQRSFTLSYEDIKLFNPNTKTCPIFRSRRDAELNKKIYGNIPVLLNEQTGENPWQAFYMRLIDLSDHAKYLRFPWEERDRNWSVPLYEAKLILTFDHRFATFADTSRADHVGGHPRELSNEEKANAKLNISPRYFLPQKFAQEILAKYPDYESDWLLIWRDVARSTDERTCIATIIPKGVASRKCPTLGIKASITPTAILANLNSFVFDYTARQKVGAISLSYFILKQLPVLPPEAYSPDQLAFIKDRVLELTYTAWDLEPFAKDCGYEGPPFRWDKERRFSLRCELDAAYFLLYGIKRDDVDYIMETFPIVKKNDEKQYGNYRTKQVILSYYDAMHRAIRTGKPYRTLLIPPPADLSVAHPPRR